MKKIIAPIFAILIISGCHVRKYDENANIVCDETWNYCLDFSALTTNRKWTKNWAGGPYGKPTAYTISNGLATDDKDFKILDIYESAMGNCEEIGVTNPTTVNINDIVGVMGKVDYPLDYDAKPLLPDCRAVFPFTASYILCVEKMNRQVAICVTQVTDDPVMAEKIFSTFRWKE